MVSPPRVQQRKMQTWNDDELRRFLEAVKETPYYALFHLLLASGMRRSEILALHWSDVDLTLCQIYVSRSMHQLNNGTIIFRQPKTAKGRRSIALPPSTTLVLRKHREQQVSERLILGMMPKDDDLTFSRKYSDGRGNHSIGGQTGSDKINSILIMNQLSTK
jgi:integrase